MIILGTNSIKATGFDVDNSVRFNAADSPSLKIAIGSGATNTKKFTFSGWFKKCTNVTGTGATGAAQTIFDINGTNTGAYFNDDHDQFTMNLRNEGATNYIFKTNRKFRDNSAWLHIVVAIDTTQATEGNRVTVYFNGVEETSWAEENYPDQNYEPGFNGGTEADFYIGAVGTTKEFNGYIAEVVCIDGTKYAASDFGEFDEDSPRIWKPKDVSGLTFGNKGFYLDFKDSANLGNDANGGTDLTEANLAATDQSTDTCTNNFAKINSLIPTANLTFSEGNLKLTTGGSDVTGGGIGTIGVTQGKWYWELKLLSSNMGNHTHGIISELTNPSQTALQNKVGVTQFRNDDGGEMVKDGTQTSADYGTFSTGDIMGVALNADDNQISIYKSGSAIVSNFTISTTRGVLFPFVGMGLNCETQINFGSPPYSESGGNSDGNGYGNFSMSVPSGFFSLNTKNLAEYG